MPSGKIYYIICFECKECSLMLCFDLCLFSALTPFNKFCMCVFSNHWYTQSYLKLLQMRVVSFS